MKFAITTITGVRNSFWNAHPQFNNDRRSKNRQNDYKTDIRVSFVDYVEHLRRDGQISESLSNRVTL